MKNIIVSISLIIAFATASISFPPAGQAHATTLAVTAPHKAPALFDKTRFLLHAGIAFFAIHHEYKRYREGAFSAGAPHRVTNFIKAAAVLLIGVHEAKVAYSIAANSNSRVLHALASPFSALAASLAAVRAKFVGGQGSAADIQQLNSSASAINGSASSSGLGMIHDVAAPLPSAA